MVKMNYSHTVKIYMHDHYDKYFEDEKNNMYRLELYLEIEEWLERNTSNDYDINCDDAYNNGEDFMIIGFNTEVEVCMFRMAWCKDSLSWYRPKMYEVEIVKDIPFTSDWDEGGSVTEWLYEHIGPPGLTWRKLRFTHISFYKEEDAVLFKMRW